ncbi:MAG TPA: flagellar protein FlaG [Candidatus Binatia bacterium]|nr:flagellar protein FlaG [Candidatus Binatia bacterium]
MTRIDAIAAAPVRPGQRSDGVRLGGDPNAGRPDVDAFGRIAGPDASVDGELGLVRVYAIFSFDPTSNEVRVRVVDETGRLLRTIPPESVAAMIAAMRTYAGR